MNNPYAPPATKVADPEATAGDVVYAGFWRRLGATLIDSLLLAVIIYPLLIWLYGLEALTASDAPMVKGPADFLISWVFPIIATVIFWKYRQATPGKMMLGMKVVDASTYSTLSTGQAIGRYFAYIVSTVVVFLGFLWIVWDPRKQAWHDKLAGSVVIRS
jgi:uncharacterized RDD family membrane protein YckC